jgi:hypothetical protein
MMGRTGPERLPASIAESRGPDAPARSIRSRLWSAAGHVGRFIRRRPITSAELALVAFVLWELLTDPGTRKITGLLAINTAGSLRSLWALSQVDTKDTLVALAVMGGALLIAMLPLLVLSRRSGRWAFLHLTFLGVLSYYCMPLLAGVNVVWLTITSALSLWLIRFRWLRWTAILPWLVVVAPFPIHQFGVVWNRAALLRRCETNDGRRPIGVPSESIHPGYKGVTQLRRDEALLPIGGAGGSAWLRRVGQEWKVDAPSRVNFSFWPGCVMDDELWLGRPNFVMGVRRDAATGVETIRKVLIPDEVMDFAEIVCLPETGQVLITEALTGSGLWEVTPKTGTARRLAHAAGGLGAMARRGAPGELVVVNGTELLRYSIEREEVIDRTPAAVQMFGGLDVCPLDGEAAVCDVFGRVRFFKPDADGHYQFDWGVPVPAPRELVLSPDCQYAAVTSWDDESVYLIDVKARRRIASYRVGPGLRGLTFLGPREFAVADACTMTQIVF